jgi:AraC-like DNA-binding protein
MGCAAAGSRTLSAETAAAVSSLLERIERTLQSQKNYGERLARALLTEVFDLLNSAESTAANGVELGDLPASVQQYIDTHYAEIGSIHEVADRFFYSREHLSRVFKESFNISVAQYLSRKRVLESLPLLPKMGVTNAGLAVGFRNHTTFINAFKKIIGCLPSEYKPKL